MQPPAVIYLDKYKIVDYDYLTICSCFISFEMNHYILCDEHQLGVHANSIWRTVSVVITFYII